MRLSQIGLSSHLISIMMKETHLIPGASVRICLIANDVALRVVLEFKDGRLESIETNEVSDEQRQDLVLSSEAAILRALVEGTTTLAECVDRVAIRGDVISLMCALPLLTRSASPVLAAHAVAEELSDRISQSLLAVPAIEGYQYFASSQATDRQVDLAQGASTAGRPMSSQTLHPVRCAAKPFLALAALVHEVHHPGFLAEDISSCETFDHLPSGKFKFWDVLCHDAGLVKPRLAETFFTSNRAKDVLVRSAACEVPPEQYSEIAGWALIAEWLRMKTGYSSTQLVSDTVLDPLGLRQDMLFTSSDSVLAGLSAADVSRLGVYFGHRQGQTHSFPLIADLSPQIIARNDPVWGGLASARGLGRFYEGLLKCEENAPIGRAWRAALTYSRGSMEDPILRRRANFCAGFMTDLVDHGFGESAGRNSFGYVGWMGSSWGIADPESGLACGFIHNGFVDPHLNELIRSQVVKATYEVIGGQAPG